MSNESPEDGAPESASPFPPAFRWETSTQEAPTQVMGAVGRDTALRDPSLDERSENSTPPWAQLDPSPIAEQQSDWLRLGPEAFESEVPESRSKRTLGIAMLAVAGLGLVAAAVVYFLIGGAPHRTGSGQVTAPPTTAPSAQPVLPTVPAAAPPVTAVAPATPAAPPPGPAASPETTGSPEPPPIAPAAPPPAALPSNPPTHRSPGSGSQGRAAVPAPAPHTESPPTAEAPPPPPADTSAPDGFTRVPSKPWKPQAPQ